MSLRALAPVGWCLSGALCVWCGMLTRCWGDGDMFLCRSCFNDVHSFDPLVCEWGQARPVNAMCARHNRAEIEARKAVAA